MGRSGDCERCEKQFCRNWFLSGSNADFRYDLLTPILWRSVGPGEFEDFRTTTDPGGLFMCTNASDGDGRGCPFLSFHF